MNTDNNTYLSRAAGHYKSLFTLPGFWLIIILTGIISIIGSVTAFVIAYQTEQGAMEGLVFGFQVFLFPLSITDQFLHYFITKEDVVLNRKRLAALSLFVSVIWIAVLNVGAILQAALNTQFVIYYASIFAAALALGFRYLVFKTVSEFNRWQCVFAILLQPLAYLLSLLFAAVRLSNPYTINTWLFCEIVLLGFVTSGTILLFSSSIFIHKVNQIGLKMIGIGAISLFKAFLATWMGGLTRPLENYFDKLGSNSDVVLRLIAFKKQKALGQTFPKA